MRRLLAGLLVLAFAVASIPAMAQVWLKDRDEREGPGFKVSDSLVLHLGVGLEGGYATNATYGNDSVPAGRLTVTPYVDLATRSKARKVQDDGAVAVAPPKASFRLGVAAFYDHSFAVDSADKAAVDSLNGANGIGVDTHLDFVLFPEGNFSLLLDADYLRTLQPYETSADAHNRDSVRPGIGVRFRPGGGNLSLELGYRLDFMYFEDPAMDGNNRHAHDVRFYSSWKIFPKTALVSKFNFAPTFYYGDTVNENSLPVRTLFGLQGLITDRFGLKLLVGYGASFYAAGPNFDSVLAEAELMFFITPFSNVRLGGQRDFVDSFYANFFVKNGGYLSYQHMFGGVFLVTLRGDVFYRDYARNDGPYAGNDPANNLVVDVSHSERNDIWVSSTLLLEFRITDWLSVHASGSYMTDVTDFSYTYTYEDPPGSGATTTDIYPAEFQRFQVMAGVRGHY